MFKNHATSKLLFVLIFSTFSFTAVSQSNSPFSNTLGLNFSVPYTQIVGTDNSVGAKFKFVGVANNTDAIVTVIAATGGATLDVVDDNQLTKPEAFSPRIMIPDDSTGLVSFEVKLVKSNNNNIRQKMSNMSLTAMDIDGTIDTTGTVLIKEMDYICLGWNSTVSYQTTGNLGIAVAACDSGFMAQNIEGIEYPAVDTTARNVMFTVTGDDFDTFYYKAGGYNNTGAPLSRQKGLYFKGFAYNASALSLNDASFSATVNNGQVLLNWSTSNDLNSKYFVVERSEDAKTFEGIAAVDRNNTGNYTTIDAAVKNTTVVYYRIKQVDNNGSTSFSKVLAVRLKVAETTMSVFPNPFVERLSIAYASTIKANATIRIVNLNGVAVTSKSVVVNKAVNNIQIDNLQNLPKGTYIAMLVVDNSLVATQKIIK
jgi:hypothetical protein